MWHDVLELEIMQESSHKEEEEEKNPTEPSVMRWEKDSREEWEASATGKARKESLYFIVKCSKGSRLGYLWKLVYKMKA